ncbi:cytochrome P450 [Nocardia jinanensis]|uniref:Cytochrome P450 n=1 Tax=Nocardia jinanensis TaxID=382504 RepID=A0A917VYR8_9NOCA|nr:cytochrome P450 [Nocardia jinanensis]GGL39910.1 cytochrome P450 [Nocardia jinanensis]
MFLPPPAAQSTVVPLIHGSPQSTDGPRVPFYSEEIAQAPHRAYREMRRRYGALVPVELAPGVPATLVVGYHTAVRILNDPEHFPADSRIWQQGIPRNCPVLPLLEWRPSAVRNSGPVHARYRQATVAGVSGVDSFSIHSRVERIAVPLINAFCTTGSAELIGQYAFPLTFALLNDILGCPSEIGRRAAAGMAAMVEGTGADAGDGGAMLEQAMADLVGLKRAEPGQDIVTRMVHDPANLDDEEMMHNVLSFYGAGIEPLQNLIINTLRLILTDERFAGGVIGGSLSTRDAVDEVLFTDPPVANYAVSFPRQPVLIDGVWLPAHQPVMISLAACNNDPAIDTGEYTDNRAHLAWSIGAHMCPAKEVAYLVAQEAIDQLLDALPELRLAVPAGELTWRPGPFQRALTALPVEFPESAPLTI